MLDLNKRRLSKRISEYIKLAVDCRNAQYYTDAAIYYAIYKSLGGDSNYVLPPMCQGIFKLVYEITRARLSATKHGEIDYRLLSKNLLRVKYVKEVVLLDDGGIGLTIYNKTFAIDGIRLKFSRENVVNNNIYAILASALVSNYDTGTIGSNFQNWGVGFKLEVLADDWSG